MRTTGYLLMATCVLVFGCAPMSEAADDTNDEFDDAKSLKGWTVFKPGNQDLYQKLDIGKSRKGWLTLAPKANQGWYNDGVAPMLYKEVEGDFLIETCVATRRSGAPNDPPAAHYNSAGLIVRDPASAGQRQNWVVVNVGRQDPNTGTEVKTTVNSRSVLELQRGDHTGHLRLARIGTTIYALRKLSSEDKWTLLREIDRRDLPNRVQVGLMCNGWTTQSDLVAEFDYFRMSVPKDKDALTASR
jgi:hypothetical protein